ncbi:YfiR/HmsC family protein [Aliikangiella sp. G2MR2-5]|uniref:YfiR/HmsC family protein n=1 Tax=Aliikangiella sp. G2MR2-5 TaxID=2788943 RepID=UPI0018AC39EF|nr:YfiR/HmsC family protein [Aliikangiella sp. G2MR2-5]
MFDVQKGTHSAFKMALATVFLCCFYLSPVLQAAESTAEDLKAAFIVNFIRYIEWPDEKSMQSIKVVYLGDNRKQLEALEKLKKVKVRNLSITIRYAKSHADLLPADLIFLEKSSADQLRQLNGLIKDKPVLLVTQEIDEKQLFGINFLYESRNRIGFELNRYNLIYQGLKVSSDFVILGGTEIDIASLVKDLEADMVKSQSMLRALQKEVDRKQGLLDKQSEVLASQSQKIGAQEKRLQTLDTTIKAQKDSYDKLKDEYSRLNASLNLSRKELVENNQLLGTKQQELEQKSAAIDDLATLIERNKQLLLEQSKEINKQKEELKDSLLQLETQKETLLEQSSIIKNQTIALYGSILLIVSVAFSVVVIYRSYRLKKRSHSQLEEKHRQLEEIHAQLTETQDQLVESEKMAALGGLVAGVAHEINTPIGVGVTSVSHLLESIKNFKRKYEKGQLKKSELELLLEDLNESGEILDRNLLRASQLIRSFKQVSTDQTTEEVRTFGLEQYLGEICQNLRHKLKQGNHRVKIDCDEAIKITSYAGAFAQIITNLIVNSLLHGFGNAISDGEISICCRVEGDNITIEYRDNGKGIPDQQVEKVFDPFFTTNRAHGGTGLGLNICFNLMHQKLKGKIRCLHSDSGAHFSLQMPIDIKKLQPSEVE